MRHQRHFMTLILGGALLVAAGPAYSGSDKAAKTLAKFEKTGKVENCLQTYQIEEARVLDDQTILFETSGGGYYVNQLPYKCSQLGFEKSFSYTLRGIHQLCNVDTITVFTSTGPGATCGLGKFEELKKKAEE